MSLESLIENSGQYANITVEFPPNTVPTQDAMGGVDRTGNWPLVASRVPCLVNTRNETLMAFQSARNNARSAVFDARIYFYYDPVPTGITTKHRITVTDASRGEPVEVGVYAVKNVNNANSMGRLFAVDTERLRTP